MAILATSERARLFHNALMDYNVWLDADRDAYVVQNELGGPEYVIWAQDVEDEVVASGSAWMAAAMTILGRQMRGEA